MTTSIEFDAVSNSSDEHTTVGEHPVSAGVQVAQAAGGQAAQSGEPVPVDVGKGAPAQGADNAQNVQGADKPAADANAPAGNAPAANAAASNVPHEYHAEAGNVVKLPANVSIDNIKVDGHNLVLVQPDGSEIVIKDGALNVPTFIIGDVEVPRVALIAALESSHVDVAFGADGSISAGGNGAPGSAGGNFSVPPGGIGDGFGLTSLLPPTALQFGQPENRELFPSVVDRGISVVAVSLLSPDEAASETGLNGGQGQSPGSDAPSNAETSSIGTISIDAPDGIGSIVINGVTVTGTGQQIQGQFGYLTIVSFDPNTGAIEYNYTVTESVTHPKQTDGFDQTDTVPDNFSITVTDSDGDTASTTFAVAIIDDVPTAIADTDSVAAGQIGPATGNVLVGGTDAGDANTTDGVADTQGADGATVVGVAKGTTNADLDDASTLNTAIQGAYGKLTLHADGSYTYVRDANTPGGVNDVFTYTIKDGDGDTSHTTLTISIGNSTPEITDLTPEAQGGDVVVNEDDLLASRGSGESDGSDTSKESTTQGGTFTIHSPDGIASLAIDGHDFITNGTFTAGSFTTALGNTLEVTAYNAATGEVTYTYTLVDNEAHDAVQGSNSLFENFDVTLTDLDGQSANSTLSVNIVDDVPTASTEAPQNVAEGATITGTLDFGAGADGATVTHINGTLLVFGQDGYSQTIDIGDGSIKVKADGSYSFTADNPVIGTGAASATYTVTDSDGDTSTAGLSFVVTDANHPTAGTAAASVDDDGLAGGNAASTTGDIAVPNTDGDNNEATFSGTLGGSLGGDGAGANGFSFAALNGTGGTVGQESVTYSWDAGTDTLTATGPRGALFTVHVTNPATGAYTVTLLDNVVHAQGPNDENNATVDLGYVITDADSSTASGTLTITFNDDAPTASVEASQNVAEGATITGTLDFAAGADGATVTHINGTLLVFGQDGYSQAIDIGDGLIKVKADGSYSFTADSSVAGTGAASATYTVTDGDGDTATAGISFVVTDANTPTSGTAAALVDDDGLAGGNPASTMGDIDANIGDADGPASSEASFSGTLGGSLGGDGAGTNGFSFATLNGTSGTVGQENVTYSWDAGTNTLTATTTSGDRIGTPLFTVHVTDPATGAYTVTLLDNVLHAGGPNDENAIDPTTSLTYTITDADNSSATGTLTITFDDDGPSVTIAAASTVKVALDETATSSGVATIDTGAIVKGNDPDVSGSGYISTATSVGALVTVNALFGADGAAASGSTVYALTVTNANSGLTLTDGSAISLQLVNGAVVGVVSGGTFNGQAAFAISINATTGAVTVEQYLSLDHPAEATAGNGFNSYDETLALANGSLGVTVTVKDGDNDTATSNTADVSSQITFDDDGPSVTIAAASTVKVALDETATSSGVATIDTGAIVKGNDPDVSGSGYISTATSVGALVTVNALFGADGAAASGSTVYALTVTNANSGLTLTDGSAISLQLVNGAVVGVVSGGTFNGQAAFAISINATTGAVTVEQYLSLDHPAEATAGNGFNSYDETLALANGSLGVTVTVKDGDNDTASSNTADVSSQITFDDDGPSVTIAAASTVKVALDETATSSGVATIDTGAIVKGNDPDVSGSGYISTATSVGALVTVNALFGADGAAASGSTVYALTVTNANSGLTLTDGSAISLQLVNGAVVGVVSGGTFNGQAAFAISINATTGAVTVEQYLSLDHPAEATAGNGFNSYDETLALANGSLGVTVTVKDGDNDTASSNTADVSSQITFDDDGPSVTIAAASTVKVALDETATSSGVATIDTGAIVKGNDPDVSGSGYISTATSVGALVTVNALFGADGAAASGSTVYALTVTNANSGLTLTDGSAISLQLVNGAVVGVVSGGTFNGQAAFAISINATTGAVTVEQYLSLDHPAEATAGNGFNSYDETLALANGSLGVTVTVKDGDNDTATSNTADVSSQITFDDDGPTVLDKTDLYFSNSGTVSGTGVFDYSIGADGHATYSSFISDFAAITLTGTVAGNAITSPTVTWASETSTEAVFNISFSYLTGDVTTQETGTLTFDKVAGTYTVDLADPINSVTVLTTSGASAFDGYNADGSADTSGPAAVVVAQLDTNFFVQFTADKPTSGGNGVPLTATGAPGSATAYAAGDLFHAADTEVFANNANIGTGSGTIQRGEVVDMNFYTSDPGANTNNPADAQVSSVYFKVEQLGAGEDFVVILKLLDPDTNQITTRAVVVDYADVYLAGQSNPYNISYGSADGVVIIESNDYNINPGENYVITGMQLLTSTEGITGSGINLNKDTGDTGGSSGTEAFTSDNDVIKFTDIGFVTTTTTAQNADLTLNVTLKDADGDTSTAQQLDVHVVNGVTYTGTADAETMQGTANDDILNGNGGNDILQGFAGADTLNGGDGNDLLIGGLGHDTLAGGTGADTFKLDHLELNIKDLITDYNAGEGDKIDLTALFQTGGADVANFVKYDAGTGVLSVDTDGAGNGATFVEVADLTPHPAAGTINILYDDGIHAQPQTTTV